MSTVLFYNKVLYADRRQTSVVVSKDGSTYPASYSIGHKMHQHGKMVYATTGDALGWHYFRYRYFMPWFFRILDRLLCWKVPKSWFIGYDGENLEIYNYRSKKILGFTFSWWQKQSYKDDKHMLWMGSGGEFAKEAIYKGLTPFEAMCYAADRDPYTDCNLEYTNFHEENINKREVIDEDENKS